MYLFQDDFLLKNQLPKKDAHLSIPSLEKIQVLLLYTEEMNDNYKELINNMMKACKIEEASYYALQCDNTPFNISKLLAHASNLNTIILFGVDCNTLGLNITLIKNLPQEFAQKFWIKTHSLSELNNNNALKNQLWTGAFKPHFLDKQK